MGAHCSKRVVPPKRRSTLTVSPDSSEDPVRNTMDHRGNIKVESVRRDDLIAIECIRGELAERSHEFLINQMLMGVLFFENHAKVIQKLQHISASPEEKELNKTLLKHETMECTYPDAIMDEINKNVIYRPPGDYSISESLVAKRIYVINDLIEVVKSDEIPQYTSIDKPCYQCKIEECDKKGYLKLLQVENNAPILTRDYEENYEPLPGPSSRPESEYDYCRITDLRTPKLIRTDDSVAERRDTLPETCFSHKKVKQDPGEVPDEDQLEYLTEEDLWREVVYINSQGVMRYFQNGLFPNSLGKSLGFQEESIGTAKCIPGKIFCDEFDNESSALRPYEIIPAVSIAWPDDQTLNFIYREDRPTIFDTRTGIKYRWPTDGMIEEIRKMNAVLVPNGFTQKKGINKDSNLQWEINFPKAERYLEARMSHAQMKCMLVLLLLHKTFIFPTTKQNGLLSEHIRTHMFWECERNYRNWPEHRLGTKILSVLNNLKQALFVGVLPDYFIKERNLFENIPKKYLNFAQKVLMAILENPVPYFIKALRNLRYTSGKFYPPMNFDEIYQKLVAKEGADLINPQLGRAPQLKRRWYKDADHQVKHLKYLKKKEQIIRQLKEKQREEQKSKETELNLDNALDGINLEVELDKQLGTCKSKAILEIFIKSFIDIAKMSSYLASPEQALFYLKLAFYLTNILEEISASFLDELAEYRQIIGLEEARIKRKSVKSLSIEQENQKPPTPLRNSVSFNYEQSKSTLVRVNSNVSNQSKNVKNVGFNSLSKGVKPKRKAVAFAE
ncbi:uncharacterized protein LOC126746242 isoform X2 [Anthonomus grandis grandis]|uniref:uncharacterized protein LOC126746242 isoform X2 n=1 Tax=Anthonomus grandis grandis TaxID=2921223 RepID=UPI00216682B9|nr:uncharacterized protein LOC126746242 isoform X2 [Anthonomus grandis grandis]